MEKRRDAFEEWCYTRKLQIRLTDKLTNGEVLRWIGGM